MRYWLSFVDPDHDQLLGVAIVHALDESEAMRAAWARDINPGGSVRIMSIDEERAARLSFPLADFEWRLLSPDEARDLSDRVEKDLAS